VITGKLWVGDVEAAMTYPPSPPQKEVESN
jgi:hypothetical protein